MHSLNQLGVRDPDRSPFAFAKVILDHPKALLAADFFEHLSNQHSLGISPLNQLQLRFIVFPDHSGLLLEIVDYFVSQLNEQLFKPVALINGQSLLATFHFDAHGCVLLL